MAAWGTLNTLKKFLKPRVVDQFTNQNQVQTQVNPQTIQPTVADQRTVDPMASVVNNIQPYQSQVVPQPQPVQVVAQRTVDPMAPVQNNVVPSSATNTTNNQPQSIFSNVDPRIQQGYTNTLADSLSGKIYDPFAAGTKEAMARSEASQRASTANQIASSGLTGQGLASQIASGVEGDIRRDRFGTLIGIEQARNQSRADALGEARAFGTAEEGVRQSERDFAEDTRRYGLDRAEDIRRYDQNFEEDKSRYGDSQNWQAYQEALLTGSDTDVIAAYKAATGKDLDPMAVSQYRGYARKSTELGLEGQGLANEAARTAMENMKKTEAGGALANYLATHLDSDMSDPAMAPMMQKYWESLGNTGPVPKDWADQQIAAAHDVRLTTEQGAFNYQLDQLVASGQMKQEDAALLKDFNTNGMTEYLTRDPATGKVSFDYEKFMADTTGTSGGTGTIQGQGGVTVKIPATEAGQPTKNNGDYFNGEDGNLYKVEDGEPISVSAKDVIADLDSGSLKGLSEDDPVYKAALDAMADTSFSYRNRSGYNDEFVGAPAEGSWVKIKTASGTKAMKVTFNGHLNTGGTSDRAYMEFVDSDGNKYSTSGNSATVVSGVNTKYTKK